MLNIVCEGMHYKLKLNNEIALVNFVLFIF